MTDWYEEALCAQIGGEIFFDAVPGEKGAAAKRMCRLCPVRHPCLVAELEQEESLYGVFGGFGPAGRRALRRAIERGHSAEEVAASAIARDTEKKKRKRRR